MPDCSLNNPDSEGYDPSIAADIPEDARVGPAEGKPLAEDWVVPRGPDEPVVHIDGVALTMDGVMVFFYA